MKKVIFGSCLFLSGILSDALLLAGSMSRDWTIDGNYSYIWNLSQYNLFPFLIIFAIIAVFGLTIAVWGLIEK